MQVYLHEKLKMYTFFHINQLINADSDKIKTYNHRVFFDNQAPQPHQSYWLSVPYDFVCHGFTNGYTFLNCLKLKFAKGKCTLVGDMFDKGLSFSG